MVANRERAIEREQMIVGQDPDAVRGKDGAPLYSWRVALLPYMEEDPLYRKFHRDEPWDSPHNRTLLDEVQYPYRPLGSK